MPRLGFAKRALALLALVGIVFAAWAFPYTYKYEMATCPSGAVFTQCVAAQACSAGSCTGTAPSTSTEGMLLGGVTGYRLTICAAGGQTLSGAGTMQAYAWNSAEGLWSRDLGLDQNVTASGKQCQTFPDFKVGLSYDRVRFVASAVTVSGGSGLDVLLEGQQVHTQ